MSHHCIAPKHITSGMWWVSELVQSILLLGAPLQNIVKEGNMSRWNVMPWTCHSEDCLSSLRCLFALGSWSFFSPWLTLPALPNYACALKNPKKLLLFSDISDIRCSLGHFFKRKPNLMRISYTHILQLASSTCTTQQEIHLSDGYFASSLRRPLGGVSGGSEYYSPCYTCIQCVISVLIGNSHIVPNWPRQEFCSKPWHTTPCPWVLTYVQCRPLHG